MHVFCWWASNKEREWERHSVTTHFHSGTIVCFDQIRINFPWIFPLYGEWQFTRSESERISLRANRHLVNDQIIFTHWTNLTYWIWMTDQNEWSHGLRTTLLLRVGRHYYAGSSPLSSEVRACVSLLLSWLNQKLNFELNSERARWLNCPIFSVSLYRVLTGRRECNYWITEQKCRIKE